MRLHKAYNRHFVVEYLVIAALVTNGVLALDTGRVITPDGEMDHVAELASLEYDLCPVLHIRALSPAAGEVYGLGTCALIFAVGSKDGSSSNVSTACTQLVDQLSQCFELDGKHRCVPPGGKDASGKRIDMRQQVRWVKLYGLKPGSHRVRMYLTDPRNVDAEIEVASTEIVQFETLDPTVVRPACCRWYVHNAVYERTTWAGTVAQKNTHDMWNYQEIFHEIFYKNDKANNTSSRSHTMAPLPVVALVIEFGTYRGGATMYFQSILAQMLTVSRSESTDTQHVGISDYRILSIDIADVKMYAHEESVLRYALRHPETSKTEFFQASSTSELSKTRIVEVMHELRYGSKHNSLVNDDTKAAINDLRVFVILDSDHSYDHVYAELELITPLLTTGDYVIVEDSHHNGHPVFPFLGPGPFEACEAFLRDVPNAYVQDTERENKFPFTWAPQGYLIRK